MGLLSRQSNATALAVLVNSFGHGETPFAL
jgi:hypothetical protein